MTIRTAEFTSVVLNERNITAQITISIIKYIFEDNIEAITSIIEMEMEPRYQPKIIQGNFIEIKWKWINRTNEINSGTFKVDDVIYKVGRETYNLSATAYDYTNQKPDNVEIFYTGAQLVNVVGSQGAYFGLNIVYPRLGIPPAIAGFYRAQGTTVQAAMDEMNERFPREGNRIFSIRAPSRIDMLKLVGRMYGYVPNLKFGNLFFRGWGLDIADRPPVATFSPSDCLPDMEFREKTRGVFGQVLINYAVIRRNRIVDINNARVWDENTQAIANNEILPSTQEIYPNLGEAIFRGIGRLHEANNNRFSAYLEVEGHPALVAGVTINLVNFNNTRDVNPDRKKIDGKWIVIKARHRFDRRGWFTYLELWKANNVNTNFNDDGN